MKSDKYHHGGLRSELIRVATEILKNKGTDALTIRWLSSELNVSRTAPYRHFKDKEELLCAIAREGFRLFGIAMEEAWQDNTRLPTIERFAAVGCRYIAFSYDHPEYYQLMFGATGLLKNPNIQLRDEADSTFNFLKEILSYCQNEGVFLVEDTQLQARFVWCALHGYCSIITAHNDQKSASMLEDRRLFLNKIIDGLRTK